MFNNLFQLIIGDAKYCFRLVLGVLGGSEELPLNSQRSNGSAFLTFVVQTVVFLSFPAVGFSNVLFVNMRRTQKIPGADTPNSAHGGCDPI